MDIFEEVDTDGGGSVGLEDFEVGWAKGLGPRVLGLTPSVAAPWWAEAAGVTQV